MAQTLQGHSRNTEAGQKFKKATATAGQPVTLTLPAEAEQIHILHLLWFSYSGVGALAATGTITITIDSVVVLDQDIASSGNGPLDLGMMNGGYAAKNKSVEITLTAVTGLVPKLTCKYY